MYDKHTLTVGGSEMPVLLFAPQGDGPHPGLMIAQHLPLAHTGLENDPYQLEVGERYAANGFFCAMPYLFHRFVSDEDIALKRAQFRDDHTVDDMRAAFNLLASQPSVDAQRIGVLGHCWGGRVAWLAACSDERYRACVVFYGGRIKLEFVDEAPAPITLAGRMPCPVAGFFGNEDGNPSPSDVDDYEAALRANGIAHEFHRYDGAGHGFQTSNMPERYVEAVSEDAWGKAIAFLKRNLG